VASRPHRHLLPPCEPGVAVWRSGSVVGHINEVGVVASCGNL